MKSEMKTFDTQKEEKDVRFKFVIDFCQFYLCSWKMASQQDTYLESCIFVQLKSKLSIYLQLKTASTWSIPMLIDSTLENMQTEMDLR